jgi:lipopolysaccharide export system permease protein
MNWNIKFEQINIDLKELTTRTIKQVKIQETPTFELTKCLFDKNSELKICKGDSYKEIIPVLIRRMVLPLYVPVITLICSFLLFKSNRFFLNKYSVFFYSFILLVITELIIRFTGINNLLRYFYIIFPFIALFLLYLLLVFKSSREVK